MQFISEFFKETLLHLRNWGWGLRGSKRKQNFQACLYILPNSTEFSAKILQDIYSCNEITFRLLAKVSITSVIHYDYAHARTLWVFRRNKCRSVYPLSINLLYIFSVRIKWRLSVGKISAKIFIVLNYTLRSISMRLRCFAIRLTLYCIVFCEAIGGKTS